VLCALYRIGGMTIPNAYVFNIKFGFQVFGGGGMPVLTSPLFIVEGEPVGVELWRSASSSKGGSVSVVFSEGVVVELYPCPLLGRPCTYPVKRLYTSLAEALKRGFRRLEAAVEGGSIRLLVDGEPLKAPPLPRETVALVSSGCLVGPVPRDAAPSPGLGILASIPAEGGTEILVVEPAVVEEEALECVEKGGRGGWSRLCPQILRAASRCPPRRGARR